MGAVYNGEYSKAVTFFAVFAALMIMGDIANGVFGLGAFVFLIYTMFDAHRSAEARNRVAMETGSSPLPPAQDKTAAGWGIMLIVLGLFFLLRNLIPFYLMSRLWPVAFICLGGYLVYRYLRSKD